MVAQVSVPVTPQVVAHVEAEVAPTTVFTAIDRTVSAVIERLNWLDALDAMEGEDEAHFEAYVRWRVALVNDAVLQVQALLLEEGLTRSMWRDTQAHA